MPSKCVKCVNNASIRNSFNTNEMQRFVDALTNLRICILSRMKNQRNRGKKEGYVIRAYYKRLEKCVKCVNFIQPHVSQALPLDALISNASTNASINRLQEPIMISQNAASSLLITCGYCGKLWAVYITHCITTAYNSTVVNITFIIGSWVRLTTLFGAGRPRGRKLADLTYPFYTLCNGESKFFKKLTINTLQPLSTC